MSRSQMQAAVGLRDRNYFTTAYLRPALEAGLIEMRLPGKATSGNQRYRRTAAGKALVQEVEPTPQVTPQDTPQDTPQVTGHVRQLVAVLTGAMSGARLQEALRLRDRNHFTNTYLRPALEAGLVEMTIPDKPTSRNQRYRLTTAGEALAQHTGAKDASP